MDNSKIIRPLFEKFQTLKRGSTIDCSKLMSKSTSKFSTDSKKSGRKRRKFNKSKYIVIILQILIHLLLNQKSVL